MGQCIGQENCFQRNYENGNILPEGKEVSSNSGYKEEIPAGSLIAMCGELCDRNSRNIKGDGCNTNNIYSTFYQRYVSRFNLRPTNISITQSKRELSDQSKQIFFSAITEVLEY